MTSTSLVAASPPPASGGGLRAWLVVAAAAVGYGTGGALMMNVLGLFILPMRDALGWSISAVTIAPIVSLVWALASPIAGGVIDRVGSRTAAIWGMVVLAGCLAAMSVLPPHPGLLYGAAVAIGLCCAFTAVPTYTRAVATWFRGNVGLAFGLTLSGSSLVAIAALPLTGAAIVHGGWQAGLLALAGLIIALGLTVVALGLRECPAAPADGPGTPAERPSGLGIVVREVRFWLYAGVFALACVAVGGFVGHLQPILRLQGFTLTTAVSFGVLYSVAISIGRIGGGALLDRLPPYLVAAVMLSLAALGAAVLPSVDPAGGVVLAALLVLLLGLGHGAEADFLAFFGLRTFGLAAFSAIVGIYSMVSSLAVSLGIFIFGLIADGAGSYRPACYLGAGCFGTAAALILVCSRVERRHAGREQP